MKKIDINKSLIFSSTVEDVKNSLEYLDQKGYFSNSKDFSEYKEANLDFVEVGNFVFSPFAYMNDGDRYVFRYFIPKNRAVFVEEEPKKKQLRPFQSMKEFFDATGFNIGEVVHIKRFANYIYEEKTILNGFRVYTDEEFHETHLIFGSGSRSLDVLFKYFKYYKNGEWLPFGVEEWINEII